MDIMLPTYTKWVQLGVMICTIGMMIPGHSTGRYGAEARRGRRGRDQHPTEHSDPTPDRIQPCQSQDNQSLLNSFLWVLQRDPPSFFFGTIHVPYSRVWSYIPENTKDALYRADNVYFELDLTDPYTISALSGCQLLPRGERLSDIIPRPMFQRLRQHLDYVRLMMPSWVTPEQRDRGLYADYLFNAITDNWERKRPVWVMLMVNSLTKNDIRSRGTPVLDLYLAQEAQRLQKRTGAVEEVEEQCLPLNGLHLSQVLFALNQTLWQHETSRVRETSSSYDTEDLIRHYNCGDLDTVLFSHDTAQVPNFLNTSMTPHDLHIARQIDGYFREELIYKRNQRMADRIDSLLADHPNKSFFFAFGAGHFLGNNTVLDVLQSKGRDVVHAAPGQELDLGDRYRRRRKKFPPLMADIASEASLPPPVINGNLEYMDPYGRGRTRHRHGNAGNRRSRQRIKDPMPTDSEHLKYPQFNDLWVRLEASSFGPDSVFGNRTTEPTRPQAPVYAMYNSCVPCTPDVLPMILIALLLSSKQILHSMMLLWH